MFTISSNKRCFDIVRLFMYIFKVYRDFFRLLCLSTRGRRSVEKVSAIAREFCHLWCFWFGVWCWAKGMLTDQPEPGSWIPTSFVCAGCVELTFLDLGSISWNLRGGNMLNVFKFQWRATIQQSWELKGSVLCVLWFQIAISGSAPDLRELKRTRDFKET